MRPYTTPKLARRVDVMAEIAEMAELAEINEDQSSRRPRAAREGA